MYDLIKYPYLKPKIQTVYENWNTFECIISPLEKNFGSSYSNLLRKIALSYTIGSSITGIHIKGIKNEFDNLPNLEEETITIIERIKNLKFNFKGSRALLELEQSGPKTVYASDFKSNDKELIVLNQDSKICTILNQEKISISIYIESGTGFYSSNYENGEIIPIIANFSPIENIAYSINKYSHYEESCFHIKTMADYNARQVFFHSLEFLKHKTDLLHQFLT